MKKNSGTYIEKCVEHGEENIYYCPTKKAYECRICTRTCKYAKTAHQQYEDRNAQIIKDLEGRRNKIPADTLKGIINDEKKCEKDVKAIGSNFMNLIDKIRESVTKVLDGATNQYQAKEEEVMAQISALAKNATTQLNDLDKNKEEINDKIAEIKAAESSKDILVMMECSDYFEGLKEGNVVKEDLSKEIPQILTKIGLLRHFNEAEIYESIRNSQRSEGQDKRSGSHVSELCILPAMADYMILLDTINMKGRQLDLPDYRTPLYAGIAQDANCVYVAGGSSILSESLADCVRINFEGPAMEKIGNLKKARMDNCLGIIGSLMLCIGGQSNGDEIKDVEKCDLSQKNPSWSPAAKLSIGRCKAATTSFSKGGILYLYGGLHGGKALDDILRFTLEKLAWEKVELKGPLPALHSAGLVCVEKKSEMGNEGDLILFGGCPEPGKKKCQAETYRISGQDVEPLKPLVKPDCFEGNLSFIFGNQIFGKGLISLHKLGSDWSSVPDELYWPL